MPASLPEAPSDSPPPPVLLSPASSPRARGREGGRIRGTHLLALLGVLAGSVPVTGREATSLDATYRDTVERIVGKAIVDETGWERLAWLGDHFPARLAGSENLQGAIAWALETMREDGLENVRAEPVTVTHWVRGEESAELLEPARQRLHMLGLGMSVGTPAEGITAEALVVESFDELEARAAEVAGKIVLYDVPFTTYGETVRYRTRGASRAAEYGAVAALVRSVGPTSLQTPHTGMMAYGDETDRIPAAALTIEDASLIHRMRSRGETVVLRLRMGAHLVEGVETANVIAEIKGRENPEEVVVLGGHFDCWDVSAGMHDDGGGCLASWEALRILHALGLRPRRTVRVVLWANEENGLAGALLYRDAHREEVANHVLAVEMDGGVFPPRGFGYGGPDEALPRLQEIGRLLEGLEAGEITSGGGGADIGPLMREGVPGLGLRVDGNYFDYHHTPADTFDKLRRLDFAFCTASLAVITYVAADLEDRLPAARGGEDAPRSG